MTSAVDTGWRLALAMLGWAAGSALQLMQPALWSTGVYVALVIAALAMVVAVVAMRRRAWAVTLALAALAFGSTGWRAADRLADGVPAALEGRDLELTGVIASLPQSTVDGTRFLFEVEHARLDGQPVAIPAKVSLGWYRPRGRGANGDADAEDDNSADGVWPDLRAGQRWTLSARLKRPHGNLNPHGFDLELWLFERGVRATGYVRSAPPQRRDDLAGHRVDRLRQHLRDAIVARVADVNAAGMLAALVVGDQGAIERSDWELFRATGIAHLVSISGLHVTMFAWLAGALVAAGWRRSPRLMLTVATPTAARWGGLALATAYAALAGWGVPAQRTLWMIAAVVVLRSLGLRWPLALVLLAAGSVVIAVDPWALLQPGFWLSFAAVGLLMAAQLEAHGRPRAATVVARWREGLASGLRTQVVATVGLAPLTLLFFQQLSVVGFVANLVAIPLVTLLITPLALAGTLVAPLWSVAALAVQGLTAFLGWLARWPFAVWTAAAAPGWAAAAGVLGGALLVLPLPPRVRLFGLPLLLPLLWPALPRPTHGHVEVQAVDVGQGTAVLVRTRNHLLVYDSGPQYSLQADAGDRVLLPLLRARGERVVDLLMLSHRDSDHTGGAASLLARLPVAALSTSLEAGHALRAGATPHTRCAAGQQWTWDGVRFEVLHPTPELYAAPATASNALSCVLRIEDGAGRSMLLAGDIEAAQESALVIAGAVLRSDVLLVPHHGSRTSSTAAFIERVAPRVAVVQAGYRSRFGHPAPDVVARYAARGVVIQRSDRCGAWTWDGSGNGVCERDRVRRYWQFSQSPPTPPAPPAPP